MKKVSETDMTPRKVQGTKGSLDVYDIITGELTAGIRIIQADSDVPPRPHAHSEKQIIYVISGTAKITNGKETVDLNPGDFILLESNEEHYVTTQNDDLKVFEMKYQ